MRCCSTSCPADGPGHNIPRLSSPVRAPRSIPASISPRATRARPRGAYRMPAEIPATTLQLRSLVKADQTVELFLETVEVPEPGPGEVVVRVEASPINPSDLGLLLAGADVTAAIVERLGRPAGRHGAAARRRHARRGGHGWAFRCRWAMRAPERSWPPARPPPPRRCSARRWPWPGAPCTPSTAAWTRRSAWNCPKAPRRSTGRPRSSIRMTALGMVETMRLENHVALVHTAAASNLGQMLNRLCIAGADPAGEHRAQARAGGTAEIGGRHLGVQLDVPGFHRLS